MSTSSTSCLVKPAASLSSPSQESGVSTCRSTGGVLPRACTSWWKVTSPRTTHFCCAPRMETRTSWSTAPCGPRIASPC